MFTISDIASIANYYSPLINAIGTLITAIATVVLACLTRKYIQEIRHERRFRLMLEHTDDLKKQVIEPLITQLDEIRFYDFPYLPTRRVTRVRIRGPREDREEILYCGEDLDVEKHHLFADLKNHLDAELLEKYEDFKNYCKEICKIHNELKENLKKELKESKNKFIKANELLEIDEALNFLIEYLYRKKLSEKKYLKFEEWIVDESKSDRTEYDYMLGCKIIGESYKKTWYFFRSKDNQKQARKINFEIEIKELLSNVEKEFEEDLEGLCDLITKAKNCHESLLGELSKLRDYKIFKGECEFTDQYKKA